MWAVHAFEEDAAPAERLARALGLPLRRIALHRFPDGEGMPVVGGAEGTALLYRALDRPDGKLMPLLLATDAMRRAGAKRVVLVAPYMPYLRQDRVFAPGQPLSRDVLGRVIGEAFDRVVTVEPHLHRTADLTPVFGTPVTSLSAARELARAIGAAGDPLLIGPDAESEQWVEKVADELGADFIVFAKERLGDRRVRLTLPAGAKVAGRRVVLVDDICSSGGTLEAAAAAVTGAASVEIAIVHALFDEAARARLAAAGVSSIVSTDSCAHPTNAIHLAPLLASALREETA
ncbi:MAG TPA: ribose-phosphate diphosphokinase [Caulobacteraceae bacterium]